MEPRRDDDPTFFSNLESTNTLEDEEDFIDDHSSVSTAGPPPDSPVSTGRFNRPWNLATAHNRCSSDVSSITSSNTHSRRAYPAAYHNGDSQNRNTGCYPARGSHARSMSNASTTMMGNVTQEWGRSFRLFNTSRYLGGQSQPRTKGSDMGFGAFRSTVSHHHLTYGGSSTAEFERSGYNPGRKSSLSLLAGTGAGFNGSSYFTSPEMKGTSVLFSAVAPLPTSMSLPSASGSPVALTSHFPSSNFSPRSGYVSSPQANYAMGGVLRESSVVSGAQRELPTLLNALRNHLCLTGDSIIVGDRSHPLEIKRGPLIGTGGFAKVYAGVNTLRGELVAIKEMSIAGVEDIGALRAIEQEFALLKSLRHPNVVSYHLFEHSHSQKICRIVMELLTGDSTLKLLLKYGPLTELILRKLARHLLNAIAFIHKEGIFHRDIKPANILVSHRGEVKLCDFGCSKRVTELNKASSCIIGTPVYMAPELIKGEANHKADIWSMACSIFELGTGKLPWYHAGVKDNLPLMFYITTTSETPLVFPNRDREFSADFINFMELCFTRDPNNRPEASELLKHPWLSQKSVVWSRLPSAVARMESPVPSSSSLRPTHDGTALRDSGNGVDCSFSSDEARMVRDVSESVVDDDTLCQQELEEVTAAISVDLCHLLMNNPECVVRNLERRLADVGTRMSDSPYHTRTLSVQSPSLSHQEAGGTSVYDLPSLSASPEHSILHDNFHYGQVSLGASAGHFVFPSEMSETPQQQVLRINEDGNLDFATMTDEDAGYDGHLLPSVESSVFAFSYNSRAPPSNASLTRSSAGFGSVSDRYSSPMRGHTGLLSRGESPYRVPALSGTPSAPIPSPPLHAKPLPPVSTPGGGSSPRTPLPALVYPSGLRDEPLPLPGALTQSESFRGLERAKSAGEGKLRMRFAVNTAPGQEVNVELNVDVNDVQCRVVDHQPNYVVAISNDIREQITSRIKEVAAQSIASSPSHSTTCSAVHSPPISARNSATNPDVVPMSMRRESPAPAGYPSSIQTGEMAGLPPPTRGAYAVDGATTTTTTDVTYSGNGTTARNVQRLLSPRHNARMPKKKQI